MLDSRPTAACVNPVLLPEVCDELIDYYNTLLAPPKRVRGVGSSIVQGDATGKMAIMLADADGKMLNGLIPRLVAPVMGCHVYSVLSCTPRLGESLPTSDRKRVLFAVKTALFH